MAGTDSKIDTPVTRGRSGPVRTGPWVIRDNDDNIWGPFDSAAAAVKWGQGKWPNIPQHGAEGYIDGHGCWDVEALWAPGE